MIEVIKFAGGSLAIFGAIVVLCGFCITMATRDLLSLNETFDLDSNFFGSIFIIPLVLGCLFQIDKITLWEKAILSLLLIWMLWTLRQYKAYKLKRLYDGDLWWEKGHGHHSAVSLDIEFAITTFLGVLAILIIANLSVSRLVTHPDWQTQYSVMGVIASETLFGFVFVSVALGSILACNTIATVKLSEIYLKTEIKGFPYPQPFKAYILGEKKEFFVVRICNPYAARPIFHLRKDNIAAINTINKS